MSSGRFASDFSAYLLRTFQAQRYEDGFLAKAKKYGLPGRIPIASLDADSTFIAAFASGGRRTRVEVDGQL